MLYYVVYSFDLGKWVSTDETLTVEFSEAKHYRRIGDALRRAAQAMELGVTFRIYIQK